jgi:hypothetical protein
LVVVAVVVVGVVVVFIATLIGHHRPAAGRHNVMAACPKGKAG